MPMLYYSHLLIFTLCVSIAGAADVVISPATSADLSVNIATGEATLPSGKPVAYAAAQLTFAAPEIRALTLDAKAPRNYAPWYESWADEWPDKDYKSGTINAIALRPKADADGALILGSLFRMVLPESVVVTNADRSKTFVMNIDYKYNLDYGQIANLDSRLGEEFKAELHIAYKYATQRLDLIQVSADGKISVKKGTPMMVCPDLPEADAGCVALAGVYIAPWKQGTNYAVTTENIYPIKSAPPVQPINRAALATTKRKLAAGHEVKFAFIGDSITVGAEAGTWWAGLWTDKNLGYPSRVVVSLRKQFPTATITPIAAFQGGTTTKYGVEILEKNVLPAKPDLVVLSFMGNDASGPKNGPPNNPPEQFKEDMRAMIKKVKSANADVLLVITISPNPLLKTVSLARLPAYRQAMLDLAKEENVCAADCYTEWENQASRGYPPFSQMHNLVNHPGKVGHLLLANVVLRCFE
ncbi:MAG: GDSL-type esterase/lipase family protein [Planctomycetota bacterium]